MFEQIKDKPEKKIILLDDYNPGLEDFDAVIFHGDTIDLLKKIPDETVQLVISSPPYNIGKPYEEQKEFDLYLEWQGRVLSELTRVLKPGGNLCWEVGNYVEDGEVYPLDVFFYHTIKGLGLKLRNRIIWYFEHGLHAKKRFSGRYETILWFSKGDEYKFNLDLVRVPQKYPGKRYYKGKKKGQPSTNPKGKNPGDIWKILQEDWENEVWDIPNVKANHPEKTVHPAQFPIELAERLVLALSDPGDMVLDPFMGVGSTLVAALLHERKAIGADKEKEYVDIAKQRIALLESGNLKRRPLGKPKYEPKGTEKVAQPPEEWLREL